jgi:RHH-type proline utilization regulon transcriptional repressor/proline dehydrogenase/delta 1-pyrroline-5-carboxylate dehydrogenase
LPENQKIYSEIDDSISTFNYEDAMAAVKPIEAGLQDLRTRMRAATLRDEGGAVRELSNSLVNAQPALARAQTRAAQWVAAARADKRPRSFLESMLEQAPLNSVQGRSLMGLAEALLRTPDPTRVDQLVAERLDAIRGAEKSSEGPVLIRSAFALLGSASRLLPAVEDQLNDKRSAKSFFRPVVAPLARSALRKAMQAMGEVFISGETIEEALAHGRKNPALALCSYDMLGEGARTDADAQRYYQAYAGAIEALKNQPAGSLHDRSGISVKLSALEPRYSLMQRPRVHERLIPQVVELARMAARANIGFTVDAEEADRLDISLDIIAALAEDVETRAWPGLGLAVQAYGRRAPFVVDWIAQLARATGRKMTLRLVKGAYWDSEIKRAQERGLKSFPVFTSKAATDVSYLACARRLFEARDVIYSQFATHNAFTVAAILELAPSGAEFEFQRLHGMGEALYDIARARAPKFPRVRAYAPVGTHEDLLPYLVRRLLENGANSSFVHHFLNPNIPVEDVVRDPVSVLKSTPAAQSIPIQEPKALYGADRVNSIGADFGDPAELEAMQVSLRERRGQSMRGGPIIDGKPAQDASAPVVSPTSTQEVVGLTRDATREEIVHALDSAAKAQRTWDATPAQERAACLDRASELLEQRREEFLSLLVREAGKTLPDAVAELRETIDYCRYYAARGREIFGAPQEMRGPTGEKNLLSLHGRGVFVCISPWNFPLAIFAGQVTAALMAGNSVIAKPAQPTPLIAHAMIRVLHDAGVPGEVLQLTPLAGGAKFSEIALQHPAIAGVVLTGSTSTATAINRTLANREGPLVTLIAETGGLNAMVVDATALPEQVVDDVVSSAFTSAGQRCSALRVLYLQEEIADRVIEMLIGAMKTLRIGDPAELSTDVGPVISKSALEGLQKHAERMRREAKLLYACELPQGLPPGHFFAPHLFELHALDQLKTEEFGPILHVARYKGEQLQQVIEAIRGSGFGLTLGVHSRIEGVAEHVFRNVQVGNTYVNRNMIGAVVGVQPFGGCGLSGTGPKAGGPHYLLRFATERTLTINTVAIGGNVDLLG